MKSIADGCKIGYNLFEGKALSGVNVLSLFKAENYGEWRAEI